MDSVNDLLGDVVEPGLTKEIDTMNVKLQFA